MKKLISILIIAIAIISTSCNDNNLKTYDGDAYIQFGPVETSIYYASSNLRDTTKNYTFYYENASVTQDTVFFDIYAIGGISTQDRSFTLKQEDVAGATNAVAGEDYIPFDNELVKKNYVIKAGTVHTLVPIVLLRNATLKSTTPTLKIVIAADENFKLGEKTNIWRKVIFTDRLSKPNSWSDNVSRYYFGTYSVVKHAFMIQETGQKWDNDYIAALISDYSLTMYYISVLKTALVEYNNAHPDNPLTDENGVLVALP